MTTPGNPVTMQQLYEQLEERIADTARMQEAERVLDLPRDERIQHLVQNVADQLKVPWCAATVVTPDAQHFLASSQDFVDYCELDGTKCQFVVSLKGTVAINNAAQETLWQTMKRVLTPGGQPLMAYLGVPLKSRGQVLGSLCIVDIEPRDWKAQEHYVLVETAATIGALLDNPRA